MIGRRLQRANRVAQLRVRRSTRLATVAVAAILAAGCAKPNIGTVAGTVTVDGSPATRGSIAFFPANRKSPTAGSEIVDGRYSAEVALGTARVEIRVPKVLGEKKLYNTPDSPKQKILAESLPAKYNDQTELKVEVQPGENHQDFSLATH
jgi:hypothetical protein